MRGPQPPHARNATGTHTFERRCQQSVPFSCARHVTVIAKRPGSNCWASKQSGKRRFRFGSTSVCVPSVVSAVWHPGWCVSSLLLIAAKKSAASEPEPEPEPSLCVVFSVSPVCEHDTWAESCWRSRTCTHPLVLQTYGQRQPEQCACPCLLLQLRTLTREDKHTHGELRDQTTLKHQSSLRTFCVYVCDASGQHVRLDP